MMRVCTGLLALLMSTASWGAEPADGYHRAPAAIAKILETAPTPSVSVSPDHRTLAIVGRENLPTIANLSKPILRLAGYRIDPATNGPAEVRIQWLNALSLKDMASGHTVAVKLSQGMRFASPDWSPDGERLASSLKKPMGLRCGSLIGPATRSF